MLTDFIALKAYQSKSLATRSYCAAHVANFISKAVNQFEAVEGDAFKFTFDSRRSFGDKMISSFMACRDLCQVLGTLAPFGISPQELLTEAVTLAKSRVVPQDLLEQSVWLEHIDPIMLIKIFWIAAKGSELMDIAKDEYILELRQYERNSPYLGSVAGSIIRLMPIYVGQVISLGELVIPSFISWQEEQEALRRRALLADEALKAIEEEQKQRPGLVGILDKIRKHGKR